MVQSLAWLVQRQQLLAERLAQQLSCGCDSAAAASSPPPTKGATAAQQHIQAALASLAEGALLLETEDISRPEASEAALNVASALLACSQLAASEPLAMAIAARRRAQGPAAVQALRLAKAEAEVRRLAEENERLRARVRLLTEKQRRQAQELDANAEAYARRVRVMQVECEQRVAIASAARRESSVKAGRSAHDDATASNVRGGGGRTSAQPETAAVCDTIAIGSEASSSTFFESPAPPRGLGRPFRSPAVVSGGSSAGRSQPTRGPLFSNHIAEVQHADASIPQRAEFLEAHALALLASGNLWPPSGEAGREL